MAICAAGKNFFDFDQFLIFFDFCHLFCVRQRVQNKHISEKSAQIRSLPILTFGKEQFANFTEKFHCKQRLTIIKFVKNDNLPIETVNLQKIMFTGKFPHPNFIDLLHIN